MNRHTAPCVVGILFAVIVAGPLPASAIPICNNSSNTICYDNQTYPIFMGTFDAILGARYLVRTSDLQPIPGQTNFPDTFVWVVDRATGAVVARDDDSGTGAASQVLFTSPTSSELTVIVANYSQGRHGTCDVEVLSLGGVELSADDVWFGGWWLTKDVRAGDRVYAGVAPTGQDEPVSSNLALAFDSSSVATCTFNCGNAAFGEDFAGLDRLDIPWSASTGRVLVGGDEPSTTVPLRMFHARHSSGWGGAPQFQDWDGDGLTAELEWNQSGDPSLNIDTCEQFASGGASDCTAGINFAARGGTLQGWDPRDTDNDGLSDLAEVFAVRRSCQKAPQLPYNDVGTCFESTATGQGLYHPVVFPLSAFNPDPRTFDAYFHMESDVPYNPADIAQIQFAFEQEGAECFDNLQQCLNDVENRTMRIHMYWSTVPMATRYDGRGVLSEWPAYDYFNVTFPEDRKHSGVFRYGQAGPWVPTFWARNRVVYIPSRSTPSTSFSTVQVANPAELGPYAARTTTHEMGHAFGLDHGGLSGLDFNAGVANYQSVMGLGVRRQPDKPLTGPAATATLGSACPCAAGYTCVNGTCEVSCSYPSARFSRGLGASVTESPALNNTAFPASAQLAAHVSCRNQNGVPANSSCAGGNCTVTWDTTWAPGANPPGTPPGINGDLNQAVTTADVHNDINDWPIMMERGKNELVYAGYGDFTSPSGTPPTSVTEVRRLRRKPHFRVYQSHLDTTAAVDTSAWSHASLSTATLDNDSAGGAYGNSLAFSAASPDVMLIPQNPANNAMRTTNVTLDGVTPVGYRLDFHIKLNTVTGSAQYIMGNELVELYFVPGLGFYAFFEAAGGGLNVLLAEMFPAAGAWYWLSVVHDQVSGNTKLVVAPWLNGWNFNSTFNAISNPVPAVCAYRANTFHTAEKDPGHLIVGTDGVIPLDGSIDEIAFWNFPHCAWSNGGDIVNGVACTAGNGCFSGDLESEFSSNDTWDEEWLP